MRDNRTVTLKEKMCSIYEDNIHWIFYLIICYVFYIGLIKPFGDDVTQYRSYDEIVLKSGLVYEKKSEKPYTGYVTVSKDYGDTILLSYYSDGLRDGLWVVYYNQLERSKDYEDRTFDKPIKFETYILYEKGKLVNGVINKYFEDGTLKEKINYKDGRKHGIKKEFKRDGELSGIVSFNNGEFHGRCESYYSDGTLSKVENYKNNLKHGLFEWFYENGQEKYIKNYKEGLDHGLIKKWDDQGKLLYESCYKDDDKVEMSFCEGEKNNE